jgi:septal ring factor EnvC (AmiA/AmiB activator)
VIEATMYAALGFLAATFLGLMIVPAIGRRADRLARRRAEAAFPLSLEQVAAERDHLRGELAVRERAMERKLERGLSVKGQALEDVGRRDGAIAEMRTTLVEREETIATLTGNLEEMTRECNMTHERLDAESVSLASARHERDAALANGQVLSTDLQQTRAQFEATQQELAQTVERLDSSRVRLADVEIRLSDLTQRIASLTEALEAARIKRVELEAALEQAHASGADWHAKHGVLQQDLIAAQGETAQRAAQLEDALERHDTLHDRHGELETAFMARGQDLTEARASLKALAADQDAGRRKLREMEADKTRLEREQLAQVRAQSRQLAEQQREISRLTASLGVATQTALVATNDRDEVKATLGTLRAERAQLVQEVKTVQRDAMRLEGEIRAENAALRTEIASVADVIMNKFASNVPERDVNGGSSPVKGQH